MPQPPAARVAPANRAFVRELWSGGVEDADRDDERAGVAAGTDNGDGAHVVTRSETEGMVVVPPETDASLSGRVVDTQSDNGENDNGLSNRTSSMANRRRQMILDDIQENIEILENPDTESEEPWYELGWLSQVNDYQEEIENAARRHEVDPDLIHAILHIETTHGYYDAPLDVLHLNKSLRPMNVNVEFWREKGLTREAMSNVRNNIDAGTEILAQIVNRVPDGSIRKIATLYNNLGAPMVSDYGARVEKVYQEKPWRR